MTSVTSSLHETPNYDIIRPAAPPPPELAEPALSSTPRSAAHHPTVAVPFIRSPIPTRPFHVGFKRKADFDGEEEVQQDQQTHKRVKWDASGTFAGERPLPFMESYSETVSLIKVPITVHSRRKMLRIRQNSCRVTLP